MDCPFKCCSKYTSLYALYSTAIHTSLTRRIYVAERKRGVRGIEIAERKREEGGEGEADSTKKQCCHQQYICRGPSYRKMVANLWTLATIKQLIINDRESLLGEPIIVL